MLKTDETPPAEIIEAAEKVARWFAERNVDADKQYDRLLTLIQYYLQAMWLVFSAFLLAETVLLGAIAQVAKDDGFAFGGALFGLLLTVPWWTSYRYNHELYRLRIAEARALEPTAACFFTTGGDLIAGKAVLIAGRVDPVIGNLSIPRIARVLSPYRCVTSMIQLFSLAFVVIAVVYGCRLV